MKKALLSLLFLIITVMATAQDGPARQWTIYLVHHIFTLQAATSS